MARVHLAGHALTISWEEVLAGRPATESIHLPLPPSAPLRRMRTEPCVCGGVIHADPLEPMAGVTSHNRSNVHQAWRAENERVDSWTELGDKALPDAARTPEHRGVSQPNTGGAPVQPSPVTCPVSSCMTITGGRVCQFHQKAA